MSDHVGGRSASLRHHKTAVHATVGGSTVVHQSCGSRSGVNGGAASASSVVSLGFSMSSVNEPATPSGQGPASGPGPAAPKKSNWEVIEHYHKSGLHGTSSSAREKQQQVLPVFNFKFKLQTARNK